MFVKPFSDKDILYMDKDLIVVHKRAGMAVQSARAGQMDLEHALLNYLARKEKISGRQLPYLAVIHRLDQPVEGIVIFGRSKAASANLSSQLGSPKMKKEYLAVVQPVPADKEKELTDYLLKDAKTNSSMVVPATTSGCKKAQLSYRVRQVREEQALLEVHLMTGRHHQIRVQLASMGSPILGDGKYGSGDALSRGQISLCAFRLSFCHPSSGKRMQFEIVPENPSFLPFSFQSEETPASIGGE